MELEWTEYTNWWWVCARKYKLSFKCIAVLNKLPNIVAKKNLIVKLSKLH